jgi:hypothetical protein
MNTNYMTALRTSEVVRTTTDHCSDRSLKLAVYVCHEQKKKKCFCNGKHGHCANYFGIVTGGSI